MSTKEKATLKDWMQVKYFYLPFPVAVALSIAVLGGLVLSAALNGDSEKPSSRIDPFSGPLVIDAPGCEISGPDGMSIKDGIRGSAQLVLPKGTSFNGDCFPAAKAAREAEYKASRS